MLKKNYKKIMLILFLGVFLYSGFSISPNVIKNLCNINYPYESFCKCMMHIPFGF